MYSVQCTVISICYSGKIAVVAQMTMKKIYGIKPENFTWSKFQNVCVCFFFLSFLVFFISSLFAYCLLLLFLLFAYYCYMEHGTWMKLEWFVIIELNFILWSKFAVHFWHCWHHNRKPMFTLNMYVCVSALLRSFEKLFIYLFNK